MLCLQQIFRDNASLLARAENFCLFNDDGWILGETVAVTTRAGCDALGDDRVTSFANLIKLRFGGDFRRFRCSFAQRHTPISSDLHKLHGDFWSRGKIALFACGTDTPHRRSIDRFPPTAQYVDQAQGSSARNRLRPAPE
jgi:hypothetical protein